MKVIMIYIYWSYVLSEDCLCFLVYVMVVVFVVVFFKFVYIVCGEVGVDL